MKQKRMRRLLKLALDPARLLEAQGLEPDPWQSRFLHSRAARILLNCSRQAGKSTTAAALALHTALFRRRSLILVVSPSLRQSAELFRKIKAGLGKLGLIVEAVRENQAELELANGSRVVCLPGNEATVRSYSGVRLLLVDDAARVPDDLYRAVRPMLAVSRGKLVCLSTPFGKRGFFHEEWEATSRGWQRYRIPWRECPRITAEFIAQERQSLGDAWVRQEYECSFEALEGLVYPEFDVLCGTDVVPEWTGRRVGGMDFGFRNPFAAVWGFLDRDDVLWIERERYARWTPIGEHARALPRGVHWYADPSGRTEIEEMRRAGLKVFRGRNELRTGIAAVTARLRTGRLRVVRSACVNLLAEAKRYRYAAETEGEEPMDVDNHALAALRYLIATLDAGYLARERGAGS